MFQILDLKCTSGQFVPHANPVPVTQIPRYMPASRAWISVATCIGHCITHNYVDKTKRNGPLEANRAVSDAGGGQGGHGLPCPCYIMLKKRWPPQAATGNTLFHVSCPPPAPNFYIRYCRDLQHAPSHPHA